MPMPRLKATNERASLSSSARCPRRSTSISNVDERTRELANARRQKLRIRLERIPDVRVGLTLPSSRERRARPTRARRRRATNPKGLRRLLARPRQGPRERRADDAVGRRVGAQIAPSLGRNLAACGAAAACTQTVTLDLVPAGTMYEPRVQQVDLRFSRLFQVARYRIRGNVDLANLFNGNDVLLLQRRHGPNYLDAQQAIGGRLVKVGAQLDF